MIGPTRIQELLDVAVAEAEAAGANDVVPIGAVLAAADGSVLGSGRAGGETGTDFLEHAETAAVRAAGPLDDYADTTLLTTMTPCWYCAGLVRFYGIGRVVVGDAESWSNEALEWLAETGADTITLDDRRCVALFEGWARDHGGWDSLPASADGLPDQSR